MHRVITALLLAASHAAIIRPGDKYTLDLSKDSCTTIIVGKDLCGYQPVRRVLRRAARNRHRHAIEQAARRWREVDATIQDERAIKFDFHTVRCRSTP